MRQRGGDRGLEVLGSTYVHGGLPEGKQEPLYAAIPEDTDVLVTHTPPYGILDRDGSILYGSRELLGRVRFVRPRMHLFGHIHKSHGTTSDGVTVFSNAAIMDEGYDHLNAPNLLSLTVLAD